MTVQAQNMLLAPGPAVTIIDEVNGERLTGLKSIIQGRSGFMWLATNQGLLRFDGQSLKRFRHQADNPASLPHDDIRGLVEDQQGYLWLITRGGGLSRFDVQTEQFINFNFDPNDPNSLDSNQLNSMSLGQDDVLWIGSNQGINRFNRKTLRNTRLGLDLKANTGQTSASGNIHRILEDQLGRLWFSVRRKGLYLYSPHTGLVQHFEHDETEPASLDDNMVSEIFQSKDGQIWIGTAASINRFKEDTNSFARITIPLKAVNKVDHASVTRIYQDQSGSLWIGTFYNGVSRLNPGDGALQEINRGANLPDSLNALHINDIYQDDSGTLWFVTPRSGLIKIKPDALLFEHHQLANKSQLALTGVIADNHGDIWLGSSKGVYRLADDNVYLSLVNDKVGQVSALAALPGKGVLIAAEQGLQLLREDGTKVQILWDKSAVNEMVSDSQGRVYIGTSQGLFRLVDSQLETIAQGLAVKSMAVLPGTLFVASENAGLIRFDLTSNRQQVIDNTLKTKQLFADDAQRLWLLTETGQLQGFDTRNFSRLKLENAPDNLNQIIGVKNGVLWLVSGKGLHRYIHDTGQAALFDQTHGIRPDYFAANMAASLVDDKLLFGHAQGFVIFNPQSLESQSNTIKTDGQILLSDFKLFNKLMGLRSQDADSPLVTTIDNTRSLTLNHQQNWFSITFASSDYQQSDNLQYSYRMKGLSEQWIETDADTPTASFTSVAPGEYTLLFRIVDPKGLSQPHIRELNITITPPWWASNWAYLLYVMGAITLVILFNYVRTRQLRRRAAMLERGIAERTAQLRERADTIARLLEDKDRLIANISHEFRTPLTLILGPLESQLKVSPDKHTQSMLSMAQANGQRLLAMVDQLLDMARLKDQSESEAQPKQVLDTCRFLVASFGELAKKRQIAITLEPQVTDELYVNMLPDALEKILSNLLSNAIKYGGDNQAITVQVKQYEDKVLIAVRDTGPGISESDQQQIFERFTRLKNNPGYVPGAGIGLALVKDLVEQHHGDISLTSTLGKGSCFTVELPLLSQAQILESSAVTVNKALVKAVVDEVKDSQREEQSLVESQSETQQHQTQILVVEDNQDMRQYIVSCLQAQYACIEASNGEQGLQLAREILPDLIVSDVMMPKMDGFGVTKTLKSDAATCHIPIVLLTARGDKQSRMRGWAEKADEYLEKPFNADELLARIDNLLSVRALLREQFKGQLGQQKTEVESSNEDKSANASEIAVTHQLFVDQVNSVLGEHFSEESFDIAKFAQFMALSHRQLGRKTKAILDMTPAEVVRNFRLQKASELLIQGATPSVAAHKSGFSTHSYFSQCFKAKFDCNPSDYVKVSSQ